MKRRNGFPNSLKTLFDYVMDSRNSESAGICQGCIRRNRLQKPAFIHAVKTHSHTFYNTGKNVENKWKHLRDNFRAELNRMNANKSGDPGLSPSKRESKRRWFKMLLFMKNTSNARKMESNMQFQSKQLDRDSTDPEKDSCTNIDDDFVAEFLLLTIQYAHQHHRRRLGRLLSEGRGLGVESAHWRKR
jgi:hypothetical protein